MLAIRWAAIGLTMAALSTALPSALAQDASAQGQDASAGGEASADLEAILAAGEGLYLANCRQCHGSKGTAGVPLAGNEKVYPEWTASVILAGPGYMPAFDEFLTDEQVAAISNFVANSWGNDFGMVTPDVVAAFR